MIMNTTPNSDRLHISIFGNRNSGKSTLINALTNQDLAIVSACPGTTADPVSKAMELLPIGPVVITDTAGYDDEGELGELRTKKTFRQLDKTDIAVLVVDGTVGFTENDGKFLEIINKRKIPLVGVINKCDLNPTENGEAFKDRNTDFVRVSAKNKTGIDDLKNLIIEKSKTTPKETSIVEGIIESGDVAVLVVPIDKAAPKGRLILPQQQTIRAILDKGAAALTVREKELASALAALKEKPKAVITDSQAFKEVSAITPQDIPLTSFSILFARHKGELKPLIRGINRLKTLSPEDKILICEGCTHHKTCDDIGTVKIPKLLEKFLGFKPCLSFSSGTEFPENPGEYSLIIHCGGCMLNGAEMKSRIRKAEESGTAITNYGMFIAYANGILERALEPVPDAARIYKNA
ncbi:MAG: [FeFe] hydrogenase H-cluster maturation GTPase HydF [Clostridiales bacterium]|nr:[FeFe] hydrogenase H-cluster maturation GTPase HydF [Clostridiales bacterium]